MPCIAIPPAPQVGWLPSAEEDPLPTLFAALAQARGNAEAGMGQLIAGLVEEGRRFRETESGRRWASVLEGSRLAANGWMVWNMLDLDRHLTGRDELAGGDTPAALVEDLLRQLQAASIEELVELASGFGIEEAGRA